MERLRKLAEQVLTDEGFPRLPDSLGRHRVNFRYPPTAPRVRASWDYGHILDTGVIGVHFNWVEASRPDVAVEALQNLIQTVNEGGEIVQAVTGRVTTPRVLNLVETSLGKLGWPTFILFDSGVLDLGCVGNGPSSAELHAELEDHVQSGAPFVSFSPEFARN